MGAESRKTQIQSPFASEKSDMEGICLFVFLWVLFVWIFLFYLVGWLLFIFFFFFSGFKYTVLKLSLHVYVLKFLV